jgi:cell division septal protein FtsQ
MKDTDMAIIIFVMCLMYLFVCLTISWASYNLAYLAVNGKSIITNEEIKK